MVLYKIVKAEIDKICTFERLVTESLADGWEFAGDLCVSAHLLQPMIKAVIKPEAQEYLDSHIGGNNG